MPECVSLGLRAGVADGGAAAAALSCRLESSGDAYTGRLDASESGSEGGDDALLTLASSASFSATGAGDGEGDGEGDGLSEGDEGTDTDVVASPLIPLSIVAASS